METLININKTEENWILIFEFSWELDETNADKTFKDIYDQIGDFTNKKVIFKLANLKYLNSKSIGYTADVYGKIEESDGKMAITNCTDSVKDILDLVGITQIVPTFDDVEEAISSMN